MTEFDDLVVNLSRWYRFRCRVRAWFWRRVWRTLLRQSECKSPVLKNPITKSAPLFSQLEPRMPERSFYGYGNDEEKA